MDCLSYKIVVGEVPVRKSYEDEEVVMFYNIGPQAPVYFLVIPERHIPALEHLTGTNRPLAGHALFTAQCPAREQGCEEGFRAVMNCNDPGGQIVHHIHMHVLGQRQMHWPPGWVSVGAATSQSTRNILLSARFR